MDANRLWAKSWAATGPPPGHALLPGHLWDVYESAAQLVSETGNAQLEALGLKPEVYGERLRRVVLLASALHDLGKANDHFQGMITGRRDTRVNPQGLRHEWVSVLMMESLRDWLSAAIGSEIDFAIAEWAIGGHHPSADPDSPPRTGRDGSGTDIVLHLAHEDFRASLRQIQTWFRLGDLPRLEDVRLSLVEDCSVFVDLSRWSRRARQAWDTFPNTERRFVAAAKNCVIAADIAGSAVPKLIPFYRLPAAMAAIPELQHPNVTSLHPRDMLACLRLNLWDPQEQQLVSYREATVSSDLNCQ